MRIASAQRPQRSHARPHIIIERDMGLVKIITLFLIARVIGLHSTPRQIVVTGKVTDELGLEIIRLLMRTKRAPQKDHLEIIHGVTALTSEDRTALLFLDEGSLTVRDSKDFGVIEELNKEKSRLLLLPEHELFFCHKSFEHVVCVSFAAQTNEEKDYIDHSSWTLMLLEPFMHEIQRARTKEPVAAVDVRDAAAAILAVLLSTKTQRHAQKKYHLTGPAAIKLVDYMSPLEIQGNEEVVNNSHVIVSDSQVIVSDDVRRLTLRKPLSFSDSVSKRPQWRRRYRKLLPFVEIRNMARTLGLDSKEEFFDWLNNGNRGNAFGSAYFPAKPHELYIEEWRGWDDFLGARRDYQDAKRVVKNLGIQSQAQWWNFAEQHPDILAELRVPVRPHRAYRQQFLGYDDWLGLSSPPLTVSSNLIIERGFSPDDDNTSTAS